MSEPAPVGKSRAREMWTFVLVGGFAAAVNWGSRLALSSGGVPLGLSVTIAYMIGMVTAYVLSRRFVFESSGRSIPNEAGRFALVNVVAFVQVWLVTMSLAQWLLPAFGWSWRPAEVAHAAGVASPILTSYLGHRYFTFRRDKGPQTTPSASKADTMTGP